MNIIARATDISHTPRKVNLVAKTIVGLTAEKALQRLQFTVKRAAMPVSKVLKQAMGNAVTNYQVDAKSLIVQEAYATKGRTLKRGHFGGRSRYKPYEKTASHLTINLKSIVKKVASKPVVNAPKVEALPVKAEKKVTTKKVTTKKVSNNKK